MQKFIDYVKIPSNYDDFVTIFDSEAKFKPTQPPQAQRKEYFKQHLMDIMTNYIAYLIKEQIVPAKNQTEFLSKLQKNQIEHGDLVMNLAIWLDSEERTFTFQSKKPVQVPKPPPPQPRIYQAQPTTQQISTVQKQYPKPSNNQTRTYQTENKREHSGNSSGPFSLSKVDHRAQQAQQVPTTMAAQKPEQYHHATHPGPKHTNNAQPYHTNQPKKVYTHQNTTHNQIPTMQHYTPNLPDQSKPFRLRFYQKLADYFQYPERASNIRQDLSLMFQHKKG